MFRNFARQAITALGIKGVSTVALVLLISIALYAHKASAAGRKVVYAGSTVTHDLKVVAIVLTVLLVLGVATLDIQRGQELLQSGIEQIRRSGIADRVARWFT
ncbi:hypothetical protein [Halobellus ordinarius]|uniref:hypothetical protein n=1 Tax=Halobellus ordinarius TaxID=3075120 RepID=UPI0028802D59|nr:hypothetical protein [Halobellus sp. ZY16]